MQGGRILDALFHFSTSCAFRGKYDTAAVTSALNALRAPFSGPLIDLQDNHIDPAVRRPAMRVLALSR
jgi:hypothetical protein